MLVKNNFFIMFFIYSILVSCTPKIERKGYVDQKEFVNKVFENIKYTYEKGLTKERSEQHFVFISKSDMSPELFEDKIKKRLIKEGWREIPPNFDDQKLYCFGSRNRMSVVYPTKEYYQNSQGNSLSIKKENLDKWVVSIVYNYYGIDECKDVVN